MQTQRKISIIGIIAGAIVSGAGRWIVMFIIGVFIGIRMAAAGSSPTSEFSIYTNPLMLLIVFLVMSVLAITGGYTAATIAKHDEVLNGALSSFLAILLAACTFTTDPLFLMILSLVTWPVFATLGGYLRLIQKRRKQAQQPGASLETGVQHQDTQPGQSPAGRGGKSREGKGETYTLIRLGGIVLVIGIILSLWFGWSLAAFIFPGVIVLLVYGILRSFRRISR